jgi:hypothetical protein
MVKKKKQAKKRVQDSQGRTAKKGAKVAFKRKKGRSGERPRGTSGTGPRLF